MSWEDILKVRDKSQETLQEALALQRRKSPTKEKLLELEDEANQRIQELKDEIKNLKQTLKNLFLMKI